MPNRIFSWNLSEKLGFSIRLHETSRLERGMPVPSSDQLLLLVAACFNIKLTINLQSLTHALLICVSPFADEDKTAVESVNQLAYPTCKLGFALPIYCSFYQCIFLSFHLPNLSICLSFLAMLFFRLFYFHIIYHVISYQIFLCRWGLAVSRSAGGQKMSRYNVATSEPVEGWHVIPWFFQFPIYLEPGVDC